MLKKNDMFLFAGIVIIAAVIALAMRITHTDSGAGTVVTVTIDGRLYGEYPILENTVINLDEPLGHNQIVISDGSAYMAEADCPDQYCVEHRPISQNGEAIICLPHRLVVGVSAPKETNNILDTVAQ